MKTFKTILVSLLTFITYSALSQSPIDTVWKGSIDIMGTEIGIIVKFKTEAGVLSAKIDIPEQNANALELSKVLFENPKVHFELEAGPRTAVFEGIYYVDSISGTFTQLGATGRFWLLKGGAEKKDYETKFPEDLPYNSEEVTFTNGENSFAGTLTYPLTQGKHPAVVMITGSGPQNRDEEIYGFKIFAVIADYLTQNGIAVLRYDDRGVGGSKGKTVNESTTEDFAGDVLTAVEYLKTRDNINAGQIGLFGHSEGGIVASLAAGKSNDIAFIVLMAGTGVMGIDIIREQSKLIMKADNSTDREIAGYEKMLDKVYEAIRDNKNLNDIKEQIKNDIIENFDDLPKEQRKGIKDKEKYASDVAEMTIAQFSSKWMQYFLRYDPYDALTKVKCPVLMLFGELDLQVSPKQNEEPMLKALKYGGNTDYKSVIIPKANHLFQEAVTGSPGEYASLKKEFVGGFLETVSDWVLQRVRVVK
ncbi:MAG: alpha/beta hydrolase [Chlorobi bacterium]|nr:alpha/beta hydrolase [Chlorobiota bacterium]MCI0716102.1 alpha/beta hydrolase [Chlorobiota bacterium]